MGNDFSRLFTKFRFLQHQLDGIQFRMADSDIHPELYNEAVKNGLMVDFEHTINKMRLTIKKLRNTGKLTQQVIEHLNKREEYLTEQFENLVILKARLLVNSKPH